MLKVENTDTKTHLTPCSSISIANTNEDAIANWVFTVKINIVKLLKYCKQE